MKKRRPKIIKSLTEYIETIKYISLEVGELSKFIYRGQSDEKWPVSSGVIRRLSVAKQNNGHKSTLQIKPEEITSYLEETISEARKREDTHPIIKGMSDLRLLAEMQHFGAATMLIDFSYNALVALYMACSNHMGKNGSNGKVFCINYNKKSVLDEIVDYNEHILQDKKNTINEIISELGDKIATYRPYHSNTRIIKQESIFVFNSSGIIFNEKIDEEILIDKSSKERILKELNDVTGISEESVYPDFLGYLQANSARSKYKLKQPLEYFQMGNAYRLKKFVDEKEREESINKAVDCYKKAIELDPSISQAYFELGYLYTSHFKRYKEAIDSFTISLKLNKKDFEALYNRGTAYSGKWLTGKNKIDFGNAKKDFLAALSLDPKNTWVINNLADLYKSAELYIDSKYWFKKGLSIDFEDADLWYGLGEVYYNQKKYSIALSKFLKALSLHKDDSDAAYNIGLCYIKMGKDKLAERYLLKCLKQDPQNSEYCNELGLVSFRLNKLEESLHFFIDSIRYDNDNALALNNLAFCMIRKGNLNDVKIQIEKAIFLGCKDFGYKTLGHYYFCKNDSEKALENYKLSYEEFSSKREFFAEFMKDYESLNLSSYKIDFKDYSLIKRKI